MYCTISRVIEEVILGVLQTEVTSRTDGGSGVECHMLAIHSL